MSQEQLDGFYKWLCRRGRERSANQYIKMIRRWLLDPEEYENLIVSNQKSPNYRHNLVAPLRAWGKFTEDQELVDRISEIRLPPPVARGQRDPFSKDDWFAIMEAIKENPKLSTPKKHVCGLIALRGIRCGDVLRMTKNDIEQAINTGTLSFESKGGRWQHFNAKPLMKHLKGLLGCKWTGKRVCNLVSPRSKASNAQDTAGRMIRLVFDSVAEGLGMDPEDIYAHRFRHTYSTYFLQQMEGDPEAIFKLQQQMGWANLNTATNYLRRSRRKELDAVEAELFRKKRKK